ncbi:hypothetical protein Vafri_4732, partial [Volvox africanus]
AEAAMRRVSLEALAAASPSAAQRGRLLKLARRGRLRGLDPAVFQALYPDGVAATAAVAVPVAVADSPFKSVDTGSRASTQMVSIASGRSISSSPSSSVALEDGLKGHR